MKKNSDVFGELVVGVFMVAVLALLAYFTIVISGVDLLVGREKVPVTISFPDVGGLKERDSVVYRGMKVGVVERIALAPSNIVVTAEVDRDVVLRDGCNITVASVSLLGGNYLSMEEGRGEPRPLATTVFRGIPPVDWIRDLGAIARNLNDLSSRGSIQNIVTNFEAVSENLNRIVGRVERGEGLAGRLLSSDETVFQDVKEAVEEIRRTFAGAAAIAARLERGEGALGQLLSTNDTVYADLRKTMANAAEISDRLGRGEGVLGKLLSADDVIYADLKKTFANAAEISGRLERGEGALGKLLAKDDTTWAEVQAVVANVREATEKLKGKDGLIGRLLSDKELSDNAAKVVENLAAVSGRLEKGEGTLGKLTAERALYDEISALVKDVRQIVDNYRDTTPITTFGSLATGAL